jgi:hypothetical protein
MALLPLGRQNYVLAPEDCFAGALRDALRYRGDRLAPDSISVNVFATLDDRSVPAPGVLLGGAWRTASGAAPSRITVRTGGREHAAAMLRLPGRPAWGTYYLALDEGSLGNMAVTAYDRAGSVLASVALGLEREAEEAGVPAIPRS